MTRRLIYIRQPEEYAEGHNADSELVPLNILKNVCEAWNRADYIEVVCRSGMRAGIACEQMKQWGFNNVTVLPGGIDAWTFAGKPLSRKANQGAR